MIIKWFLFSMGLCLEGLNPSPLSIPMSHTSESSLNFLDRTCNKSFVSKSVKHLFQIDECRLLSLSQCSWLWAGVWSLIGVLNLWHFRKVTSHICRKVHSMPYMPDERKPTCLVLLTMEGMLTIIFAKLTWLQPSGRKLPFKSYLKWFGKEQICCTQSQYNALKPTTSITNKGIWPESFDLPSEKLVL